MHLAHGSGGERGSLDFGKTVKEPRFGGRAQQGQEVPGGQRGVSAVELGEMLAFFAVEEVYPQGMNLATLHGEETQALYPVEVG